MQRELDKKIVITGGGSGGHVSVALGFISRLEKEYQNALKQILYIGGDMAMEGEKNAKSIEHRLLQNTNIPFKIIRTGKLQRRLHPSTILLLLKTFGGIIDSYKILKEFKPDMVFSTGGYVSVPVCMVSWLLHIPIYIHEQTAAVGLANRIASRFATKIFITFPESKQHFPSKKVIHTGNIVREEVFQNTGEGEVIDACKLMKKDKLPIIYISGGSQGSHIINTVILQMLNYLTQEYQVILQTGENTITKDYEKLLKAQMKLPEKIRHRFYPVKYISSQEIGYIYNNMDLFIGRSGANTVYEIGILNKPAIFIPIPWVTHNEQYKNAKILQDLGIAKILPEGELSAETLFEAIKSFRKAYKPIDKSLLEKHFTNNALDIIFKQMKLS